ncbi:hypothetical protein RND81_11G228000 [Saponaria officinalis]|uniref:Chloroplast lumen common family protein n=1 Tax=Saponaria officinalis TaxID=3572 RepID=A0AAW1HPN1_SAPOF
MAFLSTNSISPNLNPFINSPKFSNTHSIKLSKTLIYQITTCNPKTHLQISSILPQLTSTHKKVSNFLAENAVKLLFGSVILVGSFNCSYALASQKKGVLFEEKIEENVEDDEEVYVKLLQNDPKNVDFLKIVVNLKMRKGKTKEAVKYVETLIEIEPNQVEWRLLQAFCYELMGQLTKSKRLFKEILKGSPLLLRALHGLAMVMHKNHEGPAIFDMLNEALELAQREQRVAEERNIKILIAQMLLVKGELDEASKKYQELINENPRDFRPYLCQGIIYSLQDKKKEADEQFEIYRNLVPEEFPQRGFLEDVVLAAKTESGEELEEFKSQFSFK